MKLYRLVLLALSQQPMPYHGDRHAAHEDAKAYKNMGRWDFAEDRIEFVEVEIDKEVIVRMLNGVQPEAEVIKTWAMSERGGLKEVPNGD
jgi:hypothetical protein